MLAAVCAWTLWRYRLEFRFCASASCMQQIRLSDWSGWCPESIDHLQHPCLLTTSKPGQSLPVMLRRRLDDSGRALCDLLARLDPDAGCPLIHASRHGDTSHTLAMLKELINHQPPSPTRFSMSVHNSTLGIHSIANHHRRPLQALSASGNELEALIWEAVGYLAEGQPNVVVAFSEGELPEDYVGHTAHPGFPCSVAMRLSLTEGRGLKHSEAEHQQAAPHPFDVIRWLSGNLTTLTGRQHQWHLEQP